MFKKKHTRFPKGHPFRDELPKTALSVIIRSGLQDEEIVENYPIFLNCLFRQLKIVSKEEREKMKKNQDTIRQRYELFMLAVNSGNGYTRGRSKTITLPNFNTSSPPVLQNKIPIIEEIDVDDPESRDTIISLSTSITIKPKSHRMSQVMSKSTNENKVKKRSRV